METPTEYAFHHDQPSLTAACLWPPVLRQLADYSAGRKDMRLLDLGCGNGAFAGHLSQLGYDVTGIDPSETGIEKARQRWPGVTFHLGSTDEQLAERYGTFDMLVSLEVVEHVFSPKAYAANVFSLLKPGGIALISTPFHGYWKNLVLALTGRMDKHFTALWEHGHIKFWSLKTLTTLLVTAGFPQPTFEFAGRFRPFSQSMIAKVVRPAAGPRVPGRDR